MEIMILSGVFLVGTVAFIGLMNLLAYGFEPGSIFSDE
jgi:hypothetical protein